MVDPDEALKDQLIQDMVAVIKTRLSNEDRSSVIQSTTLMNEQFDHGQVTEMLAYALVKIAEIQLALESL